MASASKLGKSYNAETAWKSLGTDLSAYDKSYLGNTLANFREISIPGFSEYSTSGPRRSNYYDQRFNLNLQNKFINPQQFVGSLFDNINSYPDAAFSGALAGKYSRIV